MFSLPGDHRHRTGDCSLAFCILKMREFQWLVCLFFLPIFTCPRVLDTLQTEQDYLRFFFFLFETEFHVSKASLKLIEQPRIIQISEPSLFTYCKALGPQTCSPSLFCVVQGMEHRPIHTCIQALWWLRNISTSERLIPLYFSLNSLIYLTY